MTVHQIVVGAAPGDAVTGIALELRGLLRGDGPSEIYARYRDPALAGEVRTLADLAPVVGTADDVLVYHVSIGEPDVMSVLAARPERLVVLYHNMTPAHLVRPFDGHLADLLDTGRGELAVLRDRAVGAIAVSGYNAAELVALGYANVRVVPPPVDLGRLLRQPPVPELEGHIESHHDGPRLLFVGQLLPHKRPDVLVEAVHVLRTYFQIPAFLVVVGAHRVPRYATALQRFVEESNLQGVWITGAVSEERLATFYRTTDLVLTASEHEGFCVPLLEAMAFGRPIVTRGAGAIPETVGDAAVVLPVDAGPVLFAEAVAELLADPVRQRELRTRGYERVLDFDPGSIRARLLAAVRELAA